MSFPNFTGKHAHDALVTPQAMLAYFQQHSRFAADIVVPEGLIFCYQPALARHMIQEDGGELVAGLPGKCYLLKRGDGKLAVCMGFGIGAPAVTALLELYIAFGVRRFMSIGSAGTLQHTCQVGSIVVCDRAIRDEGVSHHYLPPAPYSTPSPTLTAQFISALGQQGITPTIGTTWTIDAPYRETVEEARHYQQSGVLTVEMEAAALFAVAQVRGVDLASGFVISDSLADLVWDPQFESAAMTAGYRPLFHAACDALSGA